MALGKRWVCSYSTVLTLTVVLYSTCTRRALLPGGTPQTRGPRTHPPAPSLAWAREGGRLRGLWGVELGRGVATGGGSVAGRPDVVGAHGLQTALRGTSAYPPVVQTTDGHHGRTRDGSAPLAPLAVRGAHASAA